MFDIYNPNTYNEAPDGDFVFNGEKIYNLRKQKYFTIKEVIELIKMGNNLTFENINNFLINMQKSYAELLKTHEEIEKENESDDIVMSDLTIKSYHFSVAQKEMMKYLSQEEKEKLTDIILYHFTNKLQKYKLKQEIFDNLAGKIDNYLFADLCYCNDNETEQEIMEEYYSGFDTIESENEVNEIIDNEYLNLYPELKSSIKEYLLSLI